MDTTFLPWSVLSVPSYIAVVNEGQGDHHCYISGAADVIVVHKGPYGREGNHPQAWYGTAPVRDNQRGKPKRSQHKRWRGEEVYWDRGERRARRKVRDVRSELLTYTHSEEAYLDCSGYCEEDNKDFTVWGYEDHTGYHENSKGFTARGYKDRNDYHQDIKDSATQEKERR